MMDNNNTSNLIDIYIFEAIKCTFDKIQLDRPHKEQTVINTIKLLKIIFQYNEKI